MSKIIKYQIIQCRLQKRDLPKYQGDEDDEAKGDGDVEVDEKKAMTAEFSDKTNQLLDYIEKTYLKVKISCFPLALLFPGHGT